VGGLLIPLPFIIFIRFLCTQQQASKQASKQQQHHHHTEAKEKFYLISQLLPLTSPLPPGSISIISSEQ